MQARLQARTRAGLMVGLGLAAATIAADASQAQTATRQPPPRRHTTRITVVPLSRYYRQCDFWLAREHRPSGDVITPQQHCWWALR